MLSVRHRGEAGPGKRADFEAIARERPATVRGLPALAAIRYADPASWSVATAVARAVDASDPVHAAHDRTGVVVVSAEGPVEAMAAMCEASRSGSSSPIRYPASNAGSLAGLTSIAFGFRGPTLMLTLPPARGVPVALLLAEAWLRRGVVSFVVVAASSPRLSRCLLTAAEDTAITLLDAERDVAWLVEAG